MPAPNAPAVIQGQTATSESQPDQGVSVPAPLTPPRPVQLDGTGMPIPWGQPTAERSIRLELQGIDRRHMVETTFYLTRDGEALRPMLATNFTATVQNLEPGNYQWSADVSLRTGAGSLLVEPPRGDPLTPDFVILPPLPSIDRMTQSDLAGKPLAADLRAEGTLLLGVELSHGYSGAVLEVEIKKAGSAFDGAGALVTRLEGTTGNVRFAGADGPYHWRARVVPPGRPGADWRLASLGQPHDFMLFSRPPEKPETEKKQEPQIKKEAAVDDKKQQSQKQADPKDGKKDQTQKPTDRKEGQKNDKVPDSPPGPGSGKPSASAVMGTGSGGLGQGSRDPLPSRQVEQTSFWQITFVRLLMGLGATALVMVTALLLLMGLRRIVGRKSS